MKLPIDNDGYVDFGSVLYSAMKNAVGIECLQEASVEVLRKIRVKELKTLNRLQQKVTKSEMRRQSAPFFVGFRRSSLSVETTKKRMNANPIIMSILMSMCFVSWQKYSESWEEENDSKYFLDQKSKEESEDKGEHHHEKSVQVSSNALPNDNDPPPPISQQISAHPKVFDQIELFLLNKMKSG